MEEFIAGDVVVLNFPFSDLSNHKRRPSLIINHLKGRDYIVLQITSKYKFDKDSVSLNLKDFEQGHLPIDSFIRPNKIFTADKSLIFYKIAKINSSKLIQVKSKLKNILDLS